MTLKRNASAKYGNTNELSTSRANARLHMLAHPMRAIATASLTLAIAGSLGCSPGGSATIDETDQSTTQLTTEQTTDDSTAEQATESSSAFDNTELGGEGAASVNIAANTAVMKFGYSDRDIDATYNEAQATTITFGQDAVSVEGNGATTEGTSVTITEEGTYVLSGSCANGQVVVAADENAKVQIVLANVDLTCESGPCIFVQSADKAFVTLADDSQNTLSDGGGWQLSGEDGEANATIYSECDLTINGNGSLDVNATVHHGISTKDDLAVTGGTITITAADDALHGKDSVQVNGGSLSLNAEGDAIKSTETDKDDKGYVSIDGGTVNITADDDGIDASRLVRLTSGQLDISSGDDAINSDVDVLVSGGTTSINAGDDAVHGEYDVCIIGGSLLVEVCTEGLEGQCVEVAGGENVIYASDDGINASAADSSGGTVAEDPNATLEADASQQQDSGEMPAPSGAPDSSEMTSPPEDMGFQGGFGGAMEANPECDVTISGGTTTLVCTHDGDSLDSNGSLSMSGGTVYISGTTTSGNGSIDYGTEATITGGEILALGSAGMAESFGGNSSQASIVATPSGSAGDIVAVADANGNVIVQYTAENDYSWVLASAPDIVEGSEYTVLVNGQEAATATATTESQGMGMGGMGGMPQDGDMGNMPQMPQDGGMGGMPQ